MKKFFYRVKEGDTLLSISNEFFVPTMRLIGDNRLKRELEAGDLLVINEYQNCYQVKPFDTLEYISQKLGSSVERLSYLNGGITYVFYGLIITY